MTEFWSNRRVLVTGHTGFKGMWLAKWLDMLGARTLGIALPHNQYGIYGQISFSEKHNSQYIDIRDRVALTKAVQAFSPEVVFHLAAQAIVGEAKAEPAATFETNLMGTVNLLDAIAAAQSVKAAVIVTSDKVYENTETLTPYTENDRFGGDEPYAASKACAELAVAAYRNAIPGMAATGVATARAANVYGGGDLHYDRLIPYLIRTRLNNEPANIRNPGAVRPWQYVLSPLHGYMLLAERLYNDPAAFSEGFNFGPPEDELITVGQLAEMIAGRMENDDRPCELRESGLLRIDSSKSRARLGWRPVTDIRSGLEITTAFYRAMYAGDDVTKLMEQAMGVLNNPNL